MALKMPAEDKKIMIALAVLLAASLALLAYAVRSDGGSGGIPSSYSTGNSGAKAAYLLLQQMGYSPKRWTDNPRKLLELPPGTTLVLAEPLPGEEFEIDAVRSFTERGGRVLTTGINASLFFPALRPTQGMPHFQWKAYRPLEPSDMTRGIDEIEMAPLFYFDSATAETPFADGDETPIGRFSYGEGEVIWWSTPDPLTNSGIRQKDNAQLLLNSIGAPGTPVYWDEYFHQNGKTVVDSILNSPLRWGLWQVGLIGLVVIFTFSRRFGPQLGRVPVSRAAPMEYVETLAALYHRARAAHIPVEVVYERFRAKLQRQRSIKADASVEQVANSMADQLGIHSEAMVETLREIEESRHNPAFPVRRATVLVRQMHDWISRLK